MGAASIRLSAHYPLNASIRSRLGSAAIKGGPSDCRFCRRIVAFRVARDCVKRRYAVAPICRQLHSASCRTRRARSKIALLHRRGRRANRMR